MAAVTEHDTADPAGLVSELQHQLAACRAERDAAEAREAATADILGVLSASPSDAQPTFEAIARSACGSARLISAPWRGWCAPPRIFSAILCLSKTPA